MIKLDGLGSSLRERNETDAARGKGIGFFSSLLHYGIKFSINALAMTASQYHSLALQLSPKDQRRYLPTCRPCLPTSVPHALIPSDFKVDLYEGDKKDKAAPRRHPHLIPGLSSRW